MTTEPSNNQSRNRSSAEERRAHRILSGVLNMDDVSPQETPIDVGMYEIQEVLGRGGMGTVYKATHKALGRVVAIKVFHAEGKQVDLLMERLRGEGRMMAQLNHPHVLAIYDATVTDDGSPCLVLEYVDGSDLRQLLDEQGALSVTEAINIAKAVCSALDAVHQLGIVHRDVKPANVLISQENMVKLSDFGISKDLEGGEVSSLTMTGTTVGTVDYISPEQATGASLDARADIYSVGVLLYEMLAAVTPRGAYEPLTVHGAPEKLDAIVNRCLQRDPAKRFHSASELLAALDRVAISSTQSVGRPTKRYVWQVIAGLVCILVVSGLAIWYFSTDPNSSPSQPNPRNGQVEGGEVAENNTPTINEDWTELIPLVDIGKHAVAGNWKIENGGLRCSSLRGSRVRIPMDPGNDYELRLTMTRHTGRHSLALFLPTQSGMLTLELDAWEDHIGGVQNLNGRDMRAHGNHFPITLENGRPYNIIVKVTPQHVSLWIDGKKTHYWPIEGQAATINPLWAMPEGRFLGVGAWNAAASFQNIQVRAK